MYDFVSIYNADKKSVNALPLAWLDAYYLGLHVVPSANVTAETTQDVPALPATRKLCSMATPGLNVPTSLIAAPSASVKVTREIGSGAISEKRTCNAGAPTGEEPSSLSNMETGCETSQVASAIGAPEASAIREPSVKEVNTFLFLYEWGCEVAMSAVSGRRWLR